MKYLISVSVLFLIISCSKVGPTATLVEGQVIDIVSNEPISDIEVIILEERFTISGPEAERIATLTTDSNGRFMHEFSARPARSYLCEVNQNTPNIGILLGSSSNSSEDIDNGEDNNIELRVSFLAYIKEEFVNINCDDSTVLEVKLETDIEGTGFNYITDPCESLKLKDFRPTPYGNQIYTWRTLRNGEVLTANRDSFYLEIGERKEFTIEW
jgi:hypothetical protein